MFRVREFFKDKINVFILLLLFLLLFLILKQTCKIEMYKKLEIIKGNKCSVHILNYNRPWNITEQIIFFSKYDFIDEIVVSNGSKEHAILGKDVLKYPNVKIIDDFENNDKFKAARRWHTLSNCKNDIIISMDDDLIPSEKLLYDLVYNVIINPICLYGPFKRLCNKDGYVSNPSENNYNVILTGLASSSKKVFKQYFNNCNFNNDMKILKNNNGNGEDLLFNRYLIKEGIPCVFINEEYKFLDKSNGYSSLDDHYELRDKLCESLF